MVRALHEYSALIIMHNGHRSWSVGCVSEDRKDCEWLEGLAWEDLAEEMDELRSRVQVVPAHLVHGGDILANHTKLDS